MNNKFQVYYVSSILLGFPAEILGTSELLLQSSSSRVVLDYQQSSEVVVNASFITSLLTRLKNLEDRNGYVQVTNSPPSCDSAHKGLVYYDTDLKGLRVCSGTMYQEASGKVAYESCAHLKAQKPGTGSGTYSIQPGGTLFDAYCDMTTNSGGWTLCLSNGMRGKGLALADSNNWWTGTWDKGTRVLNDGNTDQGSNWGNFCKEMMQPNKEYEIFASVRSQTNAKAVGDVCSVTRSFFTADSGFQKLACDGTTVMAAIPKSGYQNQGCTNCIFWDNEAKPNLSPTIWGHNYYGTQVMIKLNGQSAYGAGGIHWGYVNSGMSEGNGGDVHCGEQGGWCYEPYWYSVVYKKSMQFWIREVGIAQPTVFKSCAEIKVANPSATDGIYYIKPGATPFRVRCDMTTFSGGWTLCLSNGMRGKGLALADSNNWWTSTWDKGTRVLTDGNTDQGSNWGNFCKELIEASNATQVFATVRSQNNIKSTGSLCYLTNTFFNADSGFQTLSCDGTTVMAAIPKSGYQNQGCTNCIFWDNEAKPNLSPTIWGHNYYGTQVMIKLNGQSAYGAGGIHWGYVNSGMSEGNGGDVHCGEQGGWCYEPYWYSVVYKKSMQFYVK